MSHANGDDTAAANGHADDTLPETVPPDDGDDFESDSDDDSANANVGLAFALIEPVACAAEAQAGRWREPH